MPKWVKWLLGSLLFIIILGAIAAAVLLGYVKPYRMAENAMPSQGQMILQAQSDGTVHITWPRGSNCGGYIIEVLDSEGNSLHHADVGDTTEHLLPLLPEGELTVVVSSYQFYSYLLPNDTRIREGHRSMQITGNFRMPQVSHVVAAADADTDSVTVDFLLPNQTTARLYRVEADGSHTHLKTVDQKQLKLTFGTEADLPLPDYGESWEFIFDACTRTEGYVYYGLPTGGFSVSREDLLGTVLNLQGIELGNNQYRLTWSETKGDLYEVEQYLPVSDTWTAVQTVAKDGELVFTTGHLERYSEFTFRVSSVGAEVEPEQFSVKTGASVVYSTVWPMKELELYEDTDRETVLTTAKEGQALCVLDVQGDLFYVRVGNTYGYIDSNYCMINLPDMIGDLCIYDITNSYSSLYMVHEFEIPAVTDTVIKGYEKVELQKGSYLVPLLYPTALKLEKAAFSAIEQGYKLKIYDSYRPNEATLDIYDITKAILEEPIPEAPFTDKELTDLPELAGDEVLTYQMLMTDSGRYSLANFLAKGGSRHNQGIAMDLTLTKNGKDLQMQTSIHDLSWYSESKKNNKEAKLLRSIMEGAGFGGLTSEWWHYQDNDAKQTLEPPYMKKGISVEGWTADELGWRYRRADGRFYTACQKTIGEITYQFDENGYAQVA